MKLSLKNLLPILSLVANVYASSKVISPSPPTSSETPFVRGRTFIDGESKVANTQLADVYGCCSSTSLSADGKYMFIVQIKHTLNCCRWYVYVSMQIFVHILCHFFSIIYVLMILHNTECPEGTDIKHQRLLSQVKIGTSKLLCLLVVCLSSKIHPSHHI